MAYLITLRDIPCDTAHINYLIVGESEMFSVIQWSFITHPTVVLHDVPKLCFAAAAEGKIVIGRTQDLQEWFWIV